MPNTIRLHRVLPTSPQKIYRAFTEADALAKWLPPNGFTCTVHHLEAKVGGTHRMSFRNFTTGESHAFGGEYVELIPGERLRYTDKFDDPNLPGEMQVTVILKKVSVGTELEITQAGIPTRSRPRLAISAGRNRCVHWPAWSSRRSINSPCIHLPWHASSATSSVAEESIGGIAMIVEFVRFQRPKGWTREQVLADARTTITKWRANEKLVRKHYIIGDDDMVGAFYIWPTREDAERAHDAAWRDGVTQKPERHRRSAISIWR